MFGSIRNTSTLSHLLLYSGKDERLRNRRQLLQEIDILSSIFLNGVTIGMIIYKECHGDLLFESLVLNLHQS